MKYVAVYTPRFSKELLRAERRGMPMEDIQEVIYMLENDIQLPPKYRDHPLEGEYKGCRECHIHPDWLLIYKKVKRELILVLVRTGTHSDLFR